MADKKQKNKVREASDFVNVIREAVRQEFSNRDSTVIAIVESINSDGTLNLYVLPDRQSVVRNIINQCKYTFKPGDTALLYLIGNRLSNSFVIAKYDAGGANLEQEVVDSELSATSTNPVQNNVILGALLKKQDKITQGALDLGEIKYDLGFNTEGDLIYNNHFSDVQNISSLATIYGTIGELNNDPNQWNGRVYYCYNGNQTDTASLEFASYNDWKNGFLAEYSGNPPSGRWFYKMNLKPHTIYIDLSTGFLYRFTMNDTLKNITKIQPYIPDNATVSNKLITEASIEAQVGGTDPTSSTEANYNGELYINISASPKHVFVCTKESSNEWRELTSIDGAKGGSLRSPLVISGGDSGNASKISLSRARSGQITEDGTSTLFGFLQNNTTTLTIGSGNYATNIRGNTTPTFNSSKHFAFTEDVYANIYPVGSIYISTVDDCAPASLISNSEWERFGQGRTIVGVDGTDSDFDTVLKTGGSKNSVGAHSHTFTPSGSIDSAGSHSHGITAETSEGSGSSQRYFDSGGTGGSKSTIGLNTATDGAHVHTFTGTQGTTSDTGASNGNLPPYITVYMWRRKS